MKSYIVSEEELKELVNSKELYDSNYPGNVVQDFLKSKQPITKVAGGKVKDNSFLPGIVSYTIGNMDDLKVFYKVYEMIGKNIEIYIKESK